ncbi:MAG: hypothetical protein ACI4KE_07625 [Anaerovoracaceae bacterium]
MEKKSKLSFLKMMNPSNLATQVHRYGYDFSISKYIRNVLLVFAGILVLAYFYQLKLIPILVIIAVAAVLLPGFFLAIYKAMYEEKKFDDLTNYMEQMLYSFKRRNKILSSLEDTLSLFPDGEMHDDIVSAIDFIKEADTEGNIFREALAFIEKDYGCKRLKTLHDFLINIESSGGEYELSADILLNDRKLWIDRIYAYKQDLKNVRVKVAIGIILSFLVGLTAVWVVPEDLEVVSQALSQIVTTFVFICNMIIFYLANRAMSRSVIKDEDAMKSDVMKKKYDLVFHKDLSGKKKTFLIAGLCMVPVAILLFFKLGIGAGLITIVIGYIIATQPQRQYRTAFKQIRNEVEKAFPDWLMNMSLLLQSDNVHVALSNSIKDAPPILQEELYRLEEGIASYPNAVEPYIDFFARLDIPDVKSAMKMLYSMAEFGAKDINAQIATLVERNSTMTDRAERLRAEDKLAGLGFLVLAPMVTGVLKLVTDMALIIFTMLSIVNTL